MCVHARVCVRVWERVCVCVYACVCACPCLFVFECACECVCLIENGGGGSKQTLQCQNENGQASTSVPAAVHSPIHRVAWFINICHVIPIQVWHDVFLQVTWFTMSYTHLLYISYTSCDMSHLHVWRHSNICVAWLICPRDTTHIVLHPAAVHFPTYIAWHDSFVNVWRYSCLCVTWLIHVYAWHDSILHVTWCALSFT